MAAVIVIWIGFLLDLILGDPPKLYHPVRWIGKEISFLEKRLLKRPGENKHRERRNGAVMAVIVMATAFVVSALILWICYRVHPILGAAVEGWLKA